MTHHPTPPPAADNIRRPPVILAEDDPVVRRLICSQLDGAGYTVTECSNGLEAIQALRANVSGIVLADWMMPKMDGLELCRAVRSLGADDALGFVFFILLTANSEKSQIVSGLDAGADEYLTKPYNREELLARIRVGERILTLQTQLRDRQVELHKVNARMSILNQQLQRLATTDELTRLANRRHVLARLHDLWEISKRHDRPLSCIMIDIDHFKHVNDTCGHDTGDAVLRAVGSRIRSTLRSSDAAGRLGGEEFLIVCPETNAQGATVLAERIRTEIERAEIELNGTKLKVTLSAGISGRDSRHADPDRLVSDADAAMYAAKSAGRNCVVVADARTHATPKSSANAVATRREVSKQLINSEMKTADEIEGDFQED